MKNYETPVLELERIEAQDVITVSISPVTYTEGDKSVAEVGQDVANLI